MDTGKAVFTYWTFACLVLYINGLTPGCELDQATLTCTGPNITRVPEIIPENTTEVNILNADINTLNTSAFSQIKNLYRLNVKYSGVTKLIDDAFSELSFLKALSLQGNKLTRLQSGLFSNLTLLKQLRLNENLLESVEGVFDGLRNLEILGLNDNQIVTITTETFRDLSSLHHLDLNNNKIKEIQPQAFQNMKTLMLLGLGSNPLTSVDGIFPPDMMMLQYLNMTACELTSLPNDLPSSLKYLKLTGNKIRRISKSDTQRYTDLSALILENNGLVYIEPGSFAAMTSLTNIFLFVNNLDKIPGPFPASIKGIHLDNNQIESIPPDTFQNGTKLSILSLRINNISSIHTSAFQNLEWIKELHLERNTLSVLHDETFKLAKGLIYLNLNHLTLTAIYPNCFSNLNSLSKLEMSFVRVAKDQVHGNIFRNLPVLKELELQESPTLAEVFITNLIIERKKIKTITKLNLEDNGLVSLSSDIQTYLPNIQKISLRGNRFHCNANLLWLQTWHKIEPEKFHKFDQIRCHQPRHLQGHRLADIKIWQFYDLTDSNNGSFDTSSYNVSTDDQTTDNYSHHSISNSPTTELPYYEDPDYETEYFYDYSPYSTIQSSNHSVLKAIFHTTETPLVEGNRTQTENPKTDDGENNIKKRGNKPSVQNNGGHSSSLKTVGIAFGMASGVILVMLLGAFIVYKLWKRRRDDAIKKSRHENGGQDYVFIAAQTEKQDKPEPKIHRKISRSERGSTTSHASQDITNHTDTDMKVYIMDIDA